MNAAVEAAHVDGILTHASLMVAGPAAADAVRRAKRLPGLGVGLHLVLVEGRSTLPPWCLPDIADRNSWFPSEQVSLALRFSRPGVERQLAAEILAQFRAFAATGLPLSHADAHKHMHLHPKVGSLLIRIGQAFGLPRVRIPYEPPRVLKQLGQRVAVGDRALAAWTRLLRAQARAAGLVTPDAVFGLAWNGAMTESRVLSLIANAPAGLSEFYFHPATGRDPLLLRLMPGYRHQAELHALLSPRVTAAAKPLTACAEIQPSS